MMWGYVVVFVSILVWIMLAATHEGAWNWLWFAIPAIGWPIQAIIIRRERREYGVITYSDRITARLWTIFGASELVLGLMCLGFALIGGVNCWGAMLAYTLIAAPAAGIAQGLIIRENSLTVGALFGLAVGMITMCCLVAGILLGATWYMPLFILSFVAMMIIPGHVLNYKAKHEHQ